MYGLSVRRFSILLTDGPLFYINLATHFLAMTSTSMLRRRISHLCHYSLLAEHTGERGMYDTRGCDFCCRHMEIDIHVAVGEY